MQTGSFQILAPQCTRRVPRVETSRAHVDALASHENKEVRHNKLQALSRRRANESVRKIVIAMGTAVAMMFFSRPRVSHRYPWSARRRLKTARKPSSVLNISFWTTSKGFVSTAPTEPAAMDFLAERTVAATVPGCSAGARHLSMASFAAMAITYFGTVRSTPTPVPRNQAPVPRVLRRWPSTARFGTREDAAKLTWGSAWSMIEDRTNGWFATCTYAEISNGGSAVEDAALQPWRLSQRPPSSEPKKIAARAQVMPETTTRLPRHGGRSTSHTWPSAEDAFSLWPD
mmetsp:Transcript_42465/g.121033  ORF Transcript_42465/g.121033 Transcript_42465/m.121033 type:complete len:287 (+) Transcript_42465:23-883(+)